MLISIHMPKTAGLSFRGALEEHFGDSFSHDYLDYPLAVPARDKHELAMRFCLRAKASDFSGVECIHGHFLPLKYLLLADEVDCRFVTWLREPVARLVSHYHYWLRSYDPDSDSTSPLHRRVVEEQWTLEQFCLSDELRNVYSQYLWGFPIQCFDFIGITEYFDDDLRYFSTTYLGNNIEARKINQREDAREGGPEAELSESLRKQVESFHAADLALYEQALALRAACPGRV